MPYGRSRSNSTDSRYGSRPPRTLPPSRGGTGIMLKTASRTLTSMSSKHEQRQRSDEGLGQLALAQARRHELPDDGPNPREQQVARRPGGGDEDIVAARVAEVPRVDRHRLRPADERQPREERDQRKRDRADRIDVARRIQRHAPQHPRGRVAELVGRPGVRRLVHAERRHQHREADEDKDEIEPVRQTRQGTTQLGLRATGLRAPDPTNVGTGLVVMCRRPVALEPGRT